jgi:ferredoxin--NADP+ reductase
MSYRDKDFKIIEKRQLTDESFVLRFDRHDMDFQPGQHILVGKDGNYETREYSIYSGVNEDFLEVLVKEVDDGIVSRQLHKLQLGDPIQVEGAVGFFKIKQEDLDKKFLFIASGTGISPFHCFAKSYPNLDYKILHGVRFENEAYEKDHYPKDRYVSCISKGKGGDFHGRVTKYLKNHKVEKGTQIYLCGNSDMIYDCYDILGKQGFTAEQLHAEVYF